MKSEQASEQVVCRKPREERQPRQPLPGGTGQDGMGRDGMGRDGIGYLPWGRVFFPPSLKAFSDRSCWLPSAVVVARETTYYFYMFPT